MSARLRQLALLTLLAWGAAAQPLHLVDQAGRQVVLPHTASRLVTTYTPANLFCLSLGLADNLVGIGGSTKFSPVISHFLNSSQPVQVGSRSAGTSMETIVALDPDLVLVYGKKDGNRMAAKLTQLGIGNLVLQPESFAQADEALQTLARATGTERQAARVAAASRRLDQLVASRLQGLPASARKRTYYANGSSLFRTTSAQMFQHELLQRAGLVNVAADLSGFYPKVNPEQLYAWRPQLLVVESHSAEGLAEQLRNPALAPLASLPRIALPEASFWDMPSPMARAAVLVLAANAYPERFKGVDVVAEVAGFYDALFGDACLSPLAGSGSCAQ